MSQTFYTYIVTNRKRKTLYSLPGTKWGSRTRRQKWILEPKEQKQAVNEGLIMAGREEQAGGTGTNIHTRSRARTSTSTNTNMHN